MATRRTTPISKVAPGLWVGSAPLPGTNYSGFDVIVLAAEEYQPTIPQFDGLTIRAPFADTPYPSGKTRIVAIRAARAVAKNLRKRRKVLVTCMGGLNRSALIAALALRMVSKETPDTIIRKIRNARGERALSNQAFVRIIYGFDTKRR